MIEAYTLDYFTKCPWTLSGKSSPFQVYTEQLNCTTLKLLTKTVSAWNKYSGGWSITILSMDIHVCAKIPLCSIPG